MANLEELRAGLAAVDPEWLRGLCPACGEPVVSNTYHVDGRGYVIFWECLASLADPATCDYRRVL